MIHITHARIVSDIPTFGVSLNILVRDEQLNDTRKYIREIYQAKQVHLTYEQYEPIRNIP